MKIESREFASPYKMISAFFTPQWKTLTFWVIFLLVEMMLVSVQPLVMAPLVNVAIVSDQSLIEANLDEPITLSKVNLNNIGDYITQLFSLSELSAWDTVVLLSGIYVTLIILGAVIESASFYWQSRLRISALRTFQSYVFMKLMSFSLDYFSAQNSGELVSRLEQDASTAITKYTAVIHTLATAPVLIVIYSYMLIQTNLKLMALIAATAFIQILVARSLSSRLRTLVIDEFDLIAGFRAFFSEIFQNIRVVKSFAAEDFEKSKLSLRLEKLIPINIKKAVYRHWQFPSNAIINGIANVSILIFSTRELLNGDLSVTGFLFFLFIGRALIKPITTLGQTYLDIQEMNAASERIYRISSTKSTVPNGKQKIKYFEKVIEVKNISFSYGKSQVLSNVSFDIAKGEVVALVGPSGAGKSTLIDLIMRFYDPKQGQIMMDSVDLKKFDIKSYRSMFGVVSQENLLFHTTISENITYGRTNISEADILEAAKIANAHEFISDIPGAYQAIVGDRGMRLSGGQRQRIAIARAIAHKPQLLIMDEATSSLDTESERLVQDAIQQAIKGTTAIVIAHRLSTVTHADKIIIIDKGKIIGQGTHQQLLKSSELYKKLVHLQFQGNEDA